MSIASFISKMCPSQLRLVAGRLCDTACQVNKDSFVAYSGVTEVISTLQVPIITFVT